MSDFANQINAWAKQATHRMEGVFKESVQELAGELAETIEKGGYMPVDTGFLRNSMAAAVNSIPRGPSVKPRGYRKEDFDMRPIVVAIVQARIGDSITLGFTANYAAAMEARYAFARNAAQNWDNIVKRANKKVQKDAN